MAGRVIVRRGHTISDDGVIDYDDTPIPWEEADRLAGQRVDRRRSYAFIDGQLHRSISYTAVCSGCSSGDPYDGRGGGCRECGHRGVRRHYVYVPDWVGEYD